ncbi:hypothetical protein [Actinomadura sp. 9N215]|uniref:hypothetical protein n=1 Tax=Actinomadura sp. 9N215 TaxID=3375150 RepID=UPI0037C0ADE9
MTDIVPAPQDRWAPLNPKLNREIRTWVIELRRLFDATGLSINQFARLHPITDKGTVSRYLNGKRVPRQRWLLDQLLAYLTTVDKAVTPQVREHLIDLHRRALETAHPHGYRLHLIEDELQVTITRWKEAERYANDLEQQLTERSRQVEVLHAEQERIRAAWNDDRSRMHAEYRRLGEQIAHLQLEIAALRDELSLARERAAQAEVQYQHLEARLEQMEAKAPDQLGERAANLLTELTRRYAFGDVVNLISVETLASDGRAASVESLCAFGQRVLDLDAEDFGVPEDAGEVPPDLLGRASASRMPQTPRERPRGALASLRPTYSLLLEVIAIRWHRREMSALLAAAHVAARHLPFLAWEPVLGHAGDPALIAASVAGERSRFGVPIEPEAPRVCDHTRPERAACERALRVSREPGPGWRAYLDRQHSQVAAALGDCAARCRTPCTVMTRLDDPVRADLIDRCKLAADFTDGALVGLRHAAPVGHGFGVPSPEEVQNAWRRTRTSVRRHPLGQRAFAGTDDDPYPLPGLPALFSAIAAAPIVPDTLLHDATTRITGLLADETLTLTGLK